MKTIIMAGLATVLATVLLGAPSVVSAHGNETPTPRQEPTEAPAASPLDEAINNLDLPAPQAQPPAPAPLAPGRRPQLRLIDVSLDVLLFAGFSSEDDESISTLQGGGHDPKGRGYTLGQAELSLTGVVDPYFTAEAHILSVINSNSGEATFEVEEAFLTSTGLPLGLQFEAGYFLTEFGIINPQHPHTWDWLDMPVVNSRMFGSDAMRQAGFRASWLLNLPWFSQLHVGMQNAGGATMASFMGGEIAHSHGGNGHSEDAHGGDTHAGEQADDHGKEEKPDEHAGEGEHGKEDEDDHEKDDHAEDDEDDHGHGENMRTADGHGHGMQSGPGIGGRPIIAQDVRKLQDFVYLMRWENAFDLSNELTAVFGASSLLGPNSSGRAGSTWLYGLDMKWRWTPANSFRGYPFLSWQTEYMRRHYEAAAVPAPEESGDDDHGHEAERVLFPADTLEDWGMYTQLLYGPQINWAVGLRFEYANGRGRGYNPGGLDADPFRNERYRVSPLVSWRTSEFFRLRLQYNYDNATHLEENGHTVWLGFEWLYGAHPAHRF